MKLEDVKEWVVSIGVAVVLALLIRTFVVEPYLVDGPSMQPTLESGQRLAVNKFVYRFGDPQRGDVIIFKFPKDQTRDFVKRVIALPGDTIEIKDGKVLVNDVVLEEDYIKDKCKGVYRKAVVPAGRVFVMGDNRGNSMDSRFAPVGFVPYTLIKGKAELVFWLFSNFKRLP